MSGFRYRLPLPEPPGGGWDRATRENAEVRLRAWLAAQGITVLDGPAIVLPRRHPDGTVEPGWVGLDADRDPTPAWASFDPTEPAPAERAVGQEREQLDALLAALAAGKATQAQAQRAVAWLLRRALAGDEGGG